MRSFAPNTSINEYVNRQTQKKLIHVKSWFYSKDQTFIFLKYGEFSDIVNITTSPPNTHNLKVSYAYLG